jgi:hypothetical protein
VDENPQTVGYFTTSNCKHPMAEGLAGDETTNTNGWLGYEL